MAAVRSLGLAQLDREMVSDRTYQLPHVGRVERVGGVERDFVPEWNLPLVTVSYQVGIHFGVMGLVWLNHQSHFHHYCLTH